MEIYLDLLNWCACILTVIGTWEVQKKNANLWKINLVYLGGSTLFCIFFGIQGYWINVILYLILGGFAIRGLIHHKKEKHPNYNLYKGESPVVSILNRIYTDEEWEAKRKQLLSKKMW